MYGNTPLVSVDLDYRAFVHQGLVVLLVFLGVVGVARVGHISADQNTSLKSHVDL